MRAPLLLLSLLALAAVLHQASGQGSRSRGQSQSRRPSTEAPAYDDYYYEEEGVEEEAPKKAEKPSSSSHSRGATGHSGTSSSGGTSSRKQEPANDYEDPPKPSTPKPAPSSSSTKAKPAENKPAADEKEEEPKKTGPISPSTLFLAPRKNRLHRPNVHYAARPRPTLPSFIKNPPPLGALPTTQSPAKVAVTESPRTTAKPKAKSTAAPGKGSRFNGGTSGRKRERVTTESSAVSDGERASRRFGNTGRQKNTNRPRFRAGGN